LSEKNAPSIIRSAVGCLSAIAMIKELQKHRVKVIGVDCNPLSAGLYLCNKSYVVPRGDDPKFVNSMKHICKTEKPKLLISGPEEELLALSQEKASFAELGVLVLCPDYDTVKICCNKMETYLAFRRLNVPVPRVFEKRNIEFPCIIKPTFSRGGRDIYLVKNEAELEFYIDRVKNPIIQEYITGEEFTIDTFSDLCGNALSIVPRIRLQTESGISVKGITKNDEEIIEYSKKVVKELKLIGPSCMQCIKDINGKPKFIEINPRFGGGSILSLKADNSILQNLMNLIEGKSLVPSKGFEEGLTMLRYYSEVFIGQKAILKISEC
jgi:carbamoyl-phosphate synthase large subunit